MYEHTAVPRIVAGPGSLSELSGFLAARGAETVVIVSDEGVQQAGLVARVLGVLGQAFDVHTHTAPPGEPRMADVDVAAALVREHPGAAVVGLGGGTPMDTAKLAAALAEGGGSVGECFLRPAGYAGKRPSVLVPTTAGTGSEVTRTAVCADADGRKMWCWGEELLADLVLLDPTLTTSLPATLTATTGLDALVHAVEAVTGQRRNELATATGLHAVRLAARHLRAAVAAPGHVPARQRMQEAACLAGLARENGGTGIAHSIGHALGTVYGIPHAVAVAVALRAVMPWNIIGDQSRYTPVAEAFSPGARPADVPRFYNQLLADVGLATALEPYRETRIDARLLSEASLAPENVPTIRNNARAASDMDVWSLCIGLVETWDTLLR